MVSEQRDGLTELTSYVREADTIKLIGHPLRLRILTILSNGDCNVKQLWESLGIQQPIISQHLAILRMKGIIAGRRQGPLVVYSIIDPFVKRLLSVLAA
jgi:DNA-binding transcriptional ArsR family regulator